MATTIDQAAAADGTAATTDATTEEDLFAELEADDSSWSDGDQDEAVSKESDTDSAATEEVEESADESEVEAEDENTDTKEVEEDESDTQKEQADTETDKEAQQAAERQRLNDGAAQRRIAEKQAREAQRKQAEQQYLNDSYQQSYDQAINAGFDESQAQLQAAQALALQQLQLDAYNNRVMQVENRVYADLNNAVTAIPEFKSDNPVIREAMLRAVEKFEAIHVVKDANGDATQVTGDILQFLQSEAETIRQLTGLGAKQQEQAKTQQRKRADVVPSRAPKKAQSDPDLDAFDEEIQRWM